MGLSLRALDRLLPDPPPPLVFEIGDGWVDGARRHGPTVTAHARRPLPPAEAGGPDALDGLRDAVGELIGELAPVPNSNAALLLPDTETRVAVFEFERIPRRRSELHAAVEERFRQSLPSDAGEARIAFRAQPDRGRPSVLATAAPADLVTRCESALESAGLLPSFVGVATACALHLAGREAMTAVLRVSGRDLTIAAIEGGRVLLVRQIALPQERGTVAPRAMHEILADLYPTLVYLRETYGRSVQRLLLSMPEELRKSAVTLLPQHIECPVEPLLDGDAPGSAGLQGYVRG